MLEEPGKGLRDALFFGFIDTGLVEMVLLEGGANVPPLNDTRRSRAAVVWLLVYEDAGDGWGNGRAVEVKLTMELEPGRKVRVDERATHQVEGIYGNYSFSVSTSSGIITITPFWG